jgi:uncharacterized membrane protein
MQQLLAYFLQPEKTIQLYSHRIYWGLWWLLMVVHGILSSIKWSIISIWVIAGHTLVWAATLVFIALMVDGIVQLMGRPGCLKISVYWLGFSSALLWLLPSAATLKFQWMLVGSLVSLSICCAWVYFVALTLRQVYSLNKWQLMGCFLIPVLMGVIIPVVVGGLAFSKVLLLQ